MATQPSPGPELDEQLEVASGRRAPYTQLADWVALSGVSNTAKALYWHLAMHINQQRGDFEVWPTRYTLAEWCGFRKDDSVEPYLNELVEINAIEKYKRRYGHGMRQRNVYVVHQEPPEGYAGPRSLKEFYSRRVRQSSAKSGNEFSKTAGHTEPRCVGVPEPQHSGVREARPSGVREARPSGVEPDQEKPDEIPTTSPHPPTNTQAVETTTRSREEGEEVPTSAIDPEVEEMLRSIQIPQGKRQPGPRSRKLQQVAQRCSEIVRDRERYGLGVEDLRAHLAVDLETVTYSIVGCWLYRLRDDELPACSASSTAGKTSGSLPACSVCGARAGDPAGVRTRETAEGRAARCECHPQAKTEGRNSDSQRDG